MNEVVDFIEKVVFTLNFSQVQLKTTSLFFKHQSSTALIKRSKGVSEPTVTKIIIPLQNMKDI